MREYLKLKIKKWIIGVLLANSLFVLLFGGLLLIIILIVGAVAGGSSSSTSASACEPTSSSSASEVKGNGKEAIKIKELENWDGKTRAHPVNNGSISSDFNEYRTINGKTEYHNGTDIASTGGAFAIVKGVIIEKQFSGSRGNLVAVAFKGVDGKVYNYMFQHLAKPTDKNLGDVVEMGEQIGTIGNSGGNYGVHLHVEIGLTSFTSGEPHWVDVYPTNTTVLFDTIKFFNLPREFDGDNTKKGNDDQIPSGNRCSSDGKEVTNLEGNSNAEKIFNELVKNQGFTKEGASGIIGNLMQESGCDPKKQQLGGGPGRGIMQWGFNADGGRFNSLINWAKSQNKDEWELSTQIEWMIKEMKNYSTYDYFKNITNVKEATDYFEQKMEGASNPNMEARYQYAMDALAKFGK